MNKIVINLDRKIKEIKLNTKNRENNPAKKFSTEDKTASRADIENAYQQGFKDGAASKEFELEQFKKNIIAQFQKVTTSLVEQQKDIYERAATSIHKLSLSIAERLLGQELSINPEALEKVIYDAVKDAGDSRNITIVLNPEDFRMLKEISSSVLNNPDYDIRSMPNIERGGCIVETDAGIIDAQLSVRIEEYLNYLNKTQYHESTA